jgi:hypothetical protein
MISAHHKQERCFSGPFLYWETNTAADAFQIECGEYRTLRIKNKAKLKSDLYLNIIPKCPNEDRKYCCILSTWLMPVEYDKKNNVILYIR